MKIAGIIALAMSHLKGTVVLVVVDINASSTSDLEDFPKRDVVVLVVDKDVVAVAFVLVALVVASSVERVVLV